MSDDDDDERPALINQKKTWVTDDRNIAVASHFLSSSKRNFF